ncbi:MAG TPA: xanthine dehydrogenase family protein subunit M [Candidatus Bathyarchaeia archaeon]|nr:xanthine dehydrogenase family protein subunit M [Candidatus Bathyarchaeia archaeon]
MARPLEMQYSEPSTLKEAFSILSKVAGAKILAGGTDVIVSMREGKIAPTHIVNIKRISGLDKIGPSTGGGLGIGALATIGAVEASAIVRNAFPMVAEAAHQLGSLPVRNRATVGGNLCNSSPSADMAPPLIALGAIAKIAGPKGRRSVKLEDFFTGPGKTALSKTEILTEILIPNPPKGSFSAFLKHGPRQCMDIATVNAAILITMKGKLCRNTVLVLGAVAPIPMRAKKAEAEIHGKHIEDEVVRKVAEMAANECVPISDVRGSADYRREVVNVLVRRLFEKALGSKLSK